MSLTDKADEILRKEAIQNLTERLIAGGRVGKCDFTDLLESEWNNADRYAIITSEVSALLQTLSNRDSLADQIRDGIIERYLSKPEHQWLIEEEMSQIEFDSPEPDYYADAVETGMA
jgi:hypothetical protein